MKKHILLIDNDKHELDYFLDALKVVPEEDGFKCTYAGTVMQAVDMLKLLVPHFIFIGKSLPGREIMFIVQRIKEEMRLQNVKIFLYTDQQDGQSNGAASFGVTGWVQRSRSSDKLGSRLATCFAE